MRPVRSVLFFVFVCALLLIFAAPALAAPPATGGTLVYQLWNKPTGIDPVHVADFEGLHVTDALFDSLTRWDAVTGEVLPSAALSWDISADAKVFTFHLDPAAKYSNGKPVTALDFKFAWERLFRQQSPFTYLFWDVKGFSRIASGRSAHLSGVAAPDATTLVVTLRSPFADFESTVGNPVLGPVPRARFSTRARAAAYGANPVGNGPFKLAKAWNHLATVQLVATSGTTYTGVKPYIARHHVQDRGDGADAYTRFQAGKLDVAGFPYEQMTDVVAAYGKSTNGLTSQPGQQVVPGPDAVTSFIDLNNKKPPFDDVRIRQAASLALDRVKLTDDAVHPTWWSPPVSPATGMLPPGNPGYVPGTWVYNMLNVSEAQALLTAAGHTDGAGLEPVTLLYFPFSGAYAREIKTELTAVGFTVNMVKVTDVGRLFSGKFSLSILGWSADNPSAENFLYALFFSGADNALCGYSGADAELSAARATVDDAARLAAWKVCDAKIGADVPVIPIAHWGRTVVCSTRLHDATLSEMELFDYTTVWIQP